MNKLFLQELIQQVQNNKTNKFLKISKFSSQEIESQYNLIKTLLSNPQKYKDAIDAVKKDITYMPLELKKKLEEENITL